MERKTKLGDSGYIGADKREDAVVRNSKGENQVQNQSQVITNQEIIKKLSIYGKEIRSQKIFGSFKS